MSTTKLVIAAAVAALATEALLVIGRHLTGESEGYLTFLMFVIFQRVTLHKKWP